MKLGFFCCYLGQAAHLLQVCMAFRGGKFAGPLKP